MTAFLIGIDDTDNLESKGTGHRARQLGQALQEAGLGELKAITRHQLLVHPAIRYTSHNSSACLLFETDAARLDEVHAFCREFLLRESASGSDCGLCLAGRDQAADEIQAFGRRAKTEVLDLSEALRLAGGAGVRLEGLTGDRGGVIGALAAVGLRAGGDDGRCLWLPGLRELEGVHSPAELKRLCGIDLVQTLKGNTIELEARVAVGDWPRPLLRDHQIVLLVEEARNGDSDWRVVAKDVLKDLSK